MLASITNRPDSTALWYGPALVRRLARLRPAFSSPPSVCAICGVVGAASGAATPKADQQAVASVAARERNTRATHARLQFSSLYALDSKLDRVHAQLASLASRRERIARERQSIRDATRRVATQLACIANDNLRFSCTRCTSSSQTTRSPSCSARNRSRRRSPRSTISSQHGATASAHRRSLACTR